ncbi:MAG: hypothetical protein ACO1Q7_00405 [Gemmatimonas sp.]
MSLLKLGTRVTRQTINVLMLSASLSWEASSQVKQVRTRQDDGTKILLSPPISLLSEDQDGIITDPPMMIAVQSDSSLLVISSTFSAARLVAGRIGLLLPTGSGPFEQRTVRLAHVNGDTVLLFDPSLGRRTVLVKGTPKFATLWSPKSLSAIARLKSGYIINALIRTPAQVGYPLHVVDSVGNVLKSLGSELNPANPDDGLKFQRILVNGESCVWSIQASNSEIQCLDKNAVVTAEYSGTPAWLLNAIPSDEERTARKPNPGIVDAVELPDGKLLIAAHVARSDWRKGMAPVRGRQRTVGNIVASITSLAIVFDPVSGSYSSPAKLDGYAVGVARDGRVFCYTTDKNGEPQLFSHQVKVSKGTKRTTRS